MKRLFLAVSVLILSLGAFAQREVGVLTIQPKAGLNIAWYTNDDSDPRVGLAAGAEFEYQLTDMFSLSAGLIYSMQGATQTINSSELSNSNQNIKIKMTAQTDYINIPILANIYLTKGLALKFGIQPAFNINSSYSASARGTSVSGSLADVGVNIKSFDFAFPIGLSYEMRNIVTEARYNIGATKILDNSDIKNSVFQFTLGYKFRL